jgi:hypothetical protein
MIHISSDVLVGGGGLIYVALSGLTGPCTYDSQGFTPYRWIRYAARQGTRAMLLRPFGANTVTRACRRSWKI